MPTYNDVAGSLQHARAWIEATQMQMEEMEADFAAAMSDSRDKGVELRVAEHKVF